MEEAAPFGPSGSWETSEDLNIYGGDFPLMYFWRIFGVAEGISLFV